ncbi:MAG TPA: hypothetical protein VFJ43_11845 [Bacteroidia bacterium]|nr:hypothetical protein [Bacteroidia bacterium]
MDTPNDISDLLLSPEYAILKANLTYFRSLLLSHSTELFSSLKKQQNEFKEQFQLNALDLSYRKRGNEDFLDQLKTGPVIFVSFHMGPVGPLLKYISDQGINLMLLFDEFHYKKWANQYRSMYQEHITQKRSSQLFEILNTEELQSGMKIAKAMRDGFSLLLFIDGNTGVGGINRQDEKLCHIDFLGKKIFARKGITYFSRMFNAPIIPVVSYYEKPEEEINYFLEFPDLIFPDKSIPKEKFAEETIQQLYKILEKYVLKYPDQWEGWLYVNNFVDKSQITEEEIHVEPNYELLPLRFNSNRFSFVFENEKYFLLNLANYRHYSINEDVYKLLAGLQTLQVIPKNISTDSVNALLRAGILTKE